MKVVAWPARSNAARNPFQKLLYDAIERETGTKVVEFSRRALLSGPAPDILHLHWPDVFLATGKGWRFWARLAVLRGLLALARARGTKIVWTAHNLQRGEQQNGALLEKHFWPRFPAWLDGVIYMTRASAQEAAQSMPALAKCPSAVIPHGHYLPVIAGLDVPEAAPRDGLPTVLFFGSITRYKNAYRVLESFLDLPPGTARLRICGKMSLRKPDTLLLEQLARLPSDRAGEVHYDDRFLLEAELVAELRDADLVVFPYDDVLNSGAAIFALSCGRPMLASDNALFRELQEAVGPDWVHLIEGDLDGAQLRTALASARALRASGVQPDLSDFDWKQIGQRTLAFYRTLL